MHPVSVRNVRNSARWTCFRQAAGSNICDVLWMVGPYKLHWHTGPAFLTFQPHWCGSRSQVLNSNGVSVCVPLRVVPRTHLNSNGVSVCMLCGDPFTSFIAANILPVSRILHGQNLDQHNDQPWCPRGCKTSPLPGNSKARKVCMVWFAHSNVAQPSCSDPIAAHRASYTSFCHQAHTFWHPYCNVAR